MRSTIIKYYSSSNTYLITDQFERHRLLLLCCWLFLYSASFSLPLSMLMLNGQEPWSPGTVAVEDGWHGHRGPVLNSICMLRATPSSSATNSKWLRARVSNILEFFCTIYWKKLTSNTHAVWMCVCDHLAYSDIEFMWQLMATTRYKQRRSYVNEITEHCIHTGILERESLSYFIHTDPLTHTHTHAVHWYCA